MSKNPCRVISPCENCPFRKDIHPFLRKARAQEIVDAIRADKIFHCHKTVNYDVGPRSKKHTAESSMCAGSMAIMLNTKDMNLPMRLGVVCGFLDYDKVKNRDVVFDTFEDFIAAQD